MSPCVRNQTPSVSTLRLPKAVIASMKDTWKERTFRKRV